MRRTPSDGPRSTAAAIAGVLQVFTHSRMGVAVAPWVEWKRPLGYYWT